MIPFKKLKKNLLVSRNEIVFSFLTIYLFSDSGGNSENVTIFNRIILLRKSRTEDLLVPRKSVSSYV